MSRERGVDRDMNLSDPGRDSVSNMKCVCYRVSPRVSEAPESRGHVLLTLPCANAGGAGLGPLGRKPALVGLSYAPGWGPEHHALMTAHEDLPLGHSDTVTQ